MINNTLNTLRDGFIKRYTPGDINHEGLKRIMDNIAAGAGALETMAATPDPTLPLAAHDMKLGKAGRGLSEALEIAKAKFDTLTSSAGLAFDSGLKEHSGLKYGPFASEIRGMARLMGPGGRAKFIQGRILAFDGESLGAVFLPPAYLSGLTEEERQKFTLQFFTVSVPKIVAAQELYNDLADHVQGVFRTAQTAITKLGQPSKYSKIERQQAENLNAEHRLKTTIGGTFAV